MRDHRGDADPTEKVDITRLVEGYQTKHPGSVKRSVKAKARATAKRAKQSRRENRR